MPYSLWRLKGVALHAMFKTEVHKPEVEMKASKATGGVSVVESASTLDSGENVIAPLCCPFGDVALSPCPKCKVVPPTCLARCHSFLRSCHYQP